MVPVAENFNNVNLTKLSYFFFIRGWDPNFIHAFTYSGGIMWNQSNTLRLQKNQNQSVK